MIKCEYDLYKSALIIKIWVRKILKMVYEIKKFLKNTLIKKQDLIKIIN